MQKIKNIEFLRIIGCISILLLHITQLINNNFSDITFYSQILRNMVRNSQKAVDLFFIISGFFFIYKLELKNTLFVFLKKKLIRLYPVLIFIMILSFILSFSKLVNFDFYSYILVFFGVLGTPLKINLRNIYNVEVFWYVSVMLWIFSFLYYFLKNFEKKYLNLILTILVLVSYSLILQMNSGKINGGCPNIFYIFDSYFLRGIGGIGIGYFIGQWYKTNEINIKKFKTTFLQSFSITLIEFISLYFFINNLLLKNLSFKNDMIFIVDFSVLFILFLIQKGYISKILNNTILGNINVYLSKYTYSIYMVHKIVYAFILGLMLKFNSCYINIHPVYYLSISLCSAIIFGVFTYHFVEKPCAKYLKQKLFNPEKQHVERVSGGGIDS